MPRTPNKKCVVCGQEYYARPHKYRETCSLKCRSVLVIKTGRNVGANSGMWKGGRRQKNGYWHVRMLDHPHAPSDGYVFEHRLVMEQMLGRFLEPNERVHHINHDKSDNRPENLMLFSSNAEHTKAEHMVPRCQRCGRFIKQGAEGCDCVAIPIKKEGENNE